ncbi:MAG: hypothetical protein IKL52_07150, partial [Candidatus Gastranaerophilales bacterium]|nr:hypothetical protein [Candidatus Gastranaerophilales bacterium]
GGSWNLTTDCPMYSHCRKELHCQPAITNEGSYWREDTTGQKTFDYNAGDAKWVDNKNSCKTWSVCYPEEKEKPSTPPRPGRGPGQPVYFEQAYATKIDYQKLEKEFGIVDVAFALAPPPGGNFCEPCVKYNQKCEITPKTQKCVKSRECYFDTKTCNRSYYDYTIPTTKPSYTGKVTPLASSYDRTNCTSSTCNQAWTCSNIKESPSNIMYRPKSCVNTRPGGVADDAPPCAIACTPVTGDPIAVSAECSNPILGSSGGGGEITCQGKVKVTGGTQGRSCVLAAGDVSASSAAGSPGQPYCMPIETEKLDRNGNKLTEPLEGDEAEAAQALARENLNHLLAASKENPDAPAVPTMATMEAAFPELYPNLQTKYKGMTNKQAYMYLLLVAAPKANCDINIKGSNYGCQSICGSRSGSSGGDSIAESNCAGKKGLPERECTEATCNLKYRPSDVSTEFWTAYTDKQREAEYNKSEGTYNHIYTWSIPYSVNQLAYGEAGEAGQYATTRISQITGDLIIKLGKGGKPNTSKKADVNGTDTYVKMSGKEILRAKGGRGGSSDVKTHKYDLCYAVAGQCKSSENSSDKVSCCNSEQGSRSTKEIIGTAVKMSLFENIKALTGNSTIVGIGAGRGGEGVGSRAGSEELYNERFFMNSSTYKTNDEDLAERTLWNKSKDKLNTPKNETYTNNEILPSAFNAKGGDGAVIIVW